MKNGLMLLAVCVLAILIFGTVGTLSRSGQDGNVRDELRALENAQDRGTIHWHVRRAKLMGKRRVVLRAPIAEYQDVRDFNDAINSNGLIVAELIEKRSYLRSEIDIISWYKFRIVEMLSTSIPKCGTCPFPSELVPAEMLPLNADEVLVPRAGGTVQSDGVEIAMVDPNFPEFNSLKRYLLFLRGGPNTNLAILRLGPAGVYVVEDTASLRPLGNLPHQLSGDMASRFGDSLIVLRTYINGVK